MQGWGRRSSPQRVGPAARGDGQDCPGRDVCKALLEDKLLECSKNPQIVTIWHLGPSEDNRTPFRPPCWAGRGVCFRTLLCTAGHFVTLVQVTPARSPQRPNKSHVREAWSSCPRPRDASGLPCRLLTQAARPPPRTARSSGDRPRRGGAAWLAQLSSREHAVLGEQV